MTEYEIQCKIDQYQVSDAPLEVKQAAIEKLEAKLVSALDVVRQQITDSQPDLSDTQGHE